MTFKRVLPELIRVCVGDARSRESIERYVILRDVRGRVRLVVEQAAGKVFDRDSLENSLDAALGKWFVRPILSTGGHSDVDRLAGVILQKSQGQWPVGWPRSITNLLGGADTPIDVGGQWTGIERTIGKEAWLSSISPAPPWPLVAGRTPPIVTFHSFKGGVGRTTLVAAYALHLARRDPPVRVAVVDLDLEAPGVGALFGVSTERGTLDVLVDHIATGVADLTDASATSLVDASVDARITVFPAGQVDDGYVQKLARLDFSSIEPGADNPVGQALKAMLARMKQNFDVILLDSRAGLHDIAGMSLHGLAHVDVLVFRGTSQNLAGLEQTLRTLGERSSTKLVLVETLLPASDDELFRVRADRTRTRVYDMLLEHVYEDGDPPQLGDSGEAHDVVCIRRRDWLDGLDSLKDRVSEVVNDAELRALAQRINEECGMGPERSPRPADGEEDIV